MILHVKTPKRFTARRTFHWEILQRKWAFNGLQFLHIQRIPSKRTRVWKEILFPSLVQCRHMSICGFTNRIKEGCSDSSSHLTSYFASIAFISFFGFQSSRVFPSFSSNHFSRKTTAFACFSFVRACFSLASSLFFFHFRTQRCSELFWIFGYCPHVPQW